MCMKRSQTHAGSARGLGRLVLTNEHYRLVVHHRTKANAVDPPPKWGDITLTLDRRITHDYVRQNPRHDTG
jgi:hypothetical protein